MSLPFPWLIAAAAVLAGLGLIWLFRPPRTQVASAFLPLWQRAVDQVGRRRLWRRPRVWMAPIAIGGMLLAAATGGWIALRARPSPPPVRVIVAATPQLAATDAAGRRQSQRLLERLDQLAEQLAPKTPMNVLVLRAGPDLSLKVSAQQWPDVRERLAMHLQNDQLALSPPDAAAAVTGHPVGEATMTYLAGQFDNIPQRPDVAHVFLPSPPGNDVGLLTAGAERVDQAVEVFVSGERFAGKATSAAVQAKAGDTAVAGNLPVTEPAVGAVLRLPDQVTGPITVRLSASDDQPLNDVIVLYPQPATLATVQTVGRPAPAVDRAVSASRRLSWRQPGQPPADLLIANEPTELPDTPQPSVLVDPLVLPPGLRVIGALREVRIATQLDQRPWNRSSLTGVSIRRASQVRLSPPWQTVAMDADGNPLIAYNPTQRQVAIFFSVAPGNTDWPNSLSWPVFWDSLSTLADGQASSRPTQWAGPAAPRRELFSPASAERAAAVNAGAIQTPPTVERLTAAAAWRVLTLAGVALLIVGWAWLVWLGRSVQISRALEKTHA